MSINEAMKSWSRDITSEEWDAIWKNQADGVHSEPVQTSNSVEQPMAVKEKNDKHGN